MPPVIDCRGRDNTVVAAVPGVVLQDDVLRSLCRGLPARLGRDHRVSRLILVHDDVLRALHAAGNHHGRGRRQAAAGVCHGSGRRRRHAGGSRAHLTARGRRRHGGRSCRGRGNGAGAACHGRGLTAHDRVGVAGQHDHDLFRAGCACKFQCRRLGDLVELLRFDVFIEKDGGVSGGADVHDREVPGPVRPDEHLDPLARLEGPRLGDDGEIPVGLEERQLVGDAYVFLGSRCGRARGRAAG